MKIPPIEVIKNWPRPDFIDPESRAPLGRIVGTLLEVLTIAVLVIRLYSRRRLTNGFGLDDTFICIAYIPATAFTIAGIITQDIFQWGRHIWDIEPRLLNSNILLNTIHLLLFDLATSLTKLSMLAMVRRLTGTSSSRIEHVVVLILSALITANCLIFILVEIFQCWPISSTWKIAEHSDHCINEEAHLKAANVINTVTDFAVVLLPIRTAMTLQLSLRQRVIVIGLFGLGVIASSMGIARTYFTWLLFAAADHDATWRNWYIWLSGLLELHLGIICASIPATKPFFVASVERLSRNKRKPTTIFGTSETVGDSRRCRSSNMNVSSLSLFMPQFSSQTDQREEETLSSNVDYNRSTGDSSALFPGPTMKEETS